MMRTLLSKLACLVPLVPLLACCPRDTTGTTGSPSSSTREQARGSAPEEIRIDRVAQAADAAPPAPPVPTVDPTPRAVGPFEIEFMPKRPVYFALSASRAKPQRLIANLHGMCNPPGYACGYWIPSASQRGMLVCPQGNSRCPDQNNAPTWNESADLIDADLEKAIAAVDAQHPGEISRDGSFLTGFSLGATVATVIAKKHPGRWPYLILNEATVALDAKSLRKAGVRAVAMIAGEIGGNVYGQKAIAANLVAQKFPAKTWVMPKAGHWYSANIDQIMAEAMDWAIAQGEGDAGAP